VVLKQYWAVPVKPQAFQFAQNGVRRARDGAWCVKVVNTHVPTTTIGAGLGEAGNRGDD
jgi:hypothetical protein